MEVEIPQIRENSVVETVSITVNTKNGNISFHCSLKHQRSPQGELDFLRHCLDIQNQRAKTLRELEKTLDSEFGEKEAHPQDS